jgi:hypothetical protein
MRDVATAGVAPGVFFRVFEMSPTPFVSDEPRFNVDHLLLVGGGTGAVDTPIRVFDLGLDIQTLTKAELVDSQTIHLVGTKEIVSGATASTGQPFDATVKFTKVKEDLADTVVVSGGEAPRSVVASSDPGLDFLTTVFAVQHVTVGPFEARVIETSAGDPAMNGDMPFLVLDLDRSASTFDLGLDINTVTKLTAPSPSEIKIEGSENLDPADIKSRAVSFSVKFTPPADTQAGVGSIVLERAP